jgi:peptide/nickel transport system ATP-binding protein
MFITHDFGVVAEIADRVAVMQHGRVVEEGSTEAVLRRPQHPYSRQLIAAVPPLTAPPPARSRARARCSIEGVSKTYRTGALFAGQARNEGAGRRFNDVPKGASLGIVGESGSGSRRSRAASSG